MAVATGVLDPYGTTALGILQVMSIRLMADPPSGYPIGMVITPLVVRDPVLLPGPETTATE